MALVSAPRTADTGAERIPSRSALWMALVSAPRTADTLARYPRERLMPAAAKQRPSLSNEYRTAQKCCANVIPAWNHYLMKDQVAFLLFAAGVATAAAIAVALGRIMQRRARTAATQHAIDRAARAQDGESSSEGQLHDAGFVILQRQAHAIWAPRVDGVAAPFDLRADFLVQDIETEEILVAEVKTGDLAPELSTATTRRQLLEYQLAFGVAAVLLVWPERQQIFRVEFPLPSAQQLPPMAADIDENSHPRSHLAPPWRLIACSALSLALAAVLLQL